SASWRPRRSSYSPSTLASSASSTRAVAPETSPTSTPIAAAAWSSSQVSALRSASSARSASRCAASRYSPAASAQSRNRSGERPLERAALGEGEQAVEMAGVERLGVDALEALEAQEGAAVDVAAGEVARRLEAVGVVADVRLQHRDDLEHVLGRPVAHVRRG